VTNPRLPREVLALVHGPAHTIVHVELLLALRAGEPRAHSLAQLAASAHVTSLAGARERLGELVAAGLVAAPADDAWRYAPADDDARRAVDLLAETYDRRPVTLMRALYERPPSAGPERATPC
jgi:hypothetical protein